MQLIVNFLPKQILPLSHFAIVSFVLITLQSSFSREVRTVDLLWQPAVEEPSC